MTFHSTAVAPTGPDTADVTGDLSLHGVTRAVTLKVTFNGATGAPKSRAYAGFEARGRIRRSDFGVGKYAFMIGDNVNLIISATFERAGP
jgi:polyisoprenoid-binding protein YceI